MDTRTLTLDVSLIRGVEDRNVTAGKVTYPSDFADFLVREHKDSELWNAATFDPDGGRKDTAVVSLSCLVLDYDGKHGAVESAASVSALWPWDHVIHSTWSHAPEAPRLRLIAPLSRPVTPAEYAALYAWAIARDPRIDPSCRNPSRFFYWPAKKSLDAESVYEYMPGEPLDPSVALAGQPTPGGGSSGAPLRAIQTPLPNSRAPGRAGLVPQGTFGEREGAADASPLKNGHAHEGATSGPAVLRVQTAAPLVSPRTGAERSGGANPFSGAVADATRLEDFAKVMERCAFVRHAVADAASLPNPQWRAVLSIASRCEEGEAIAHTISAPYPGYSEVETGHEFARVSAYGPMSCVQIQKDAGTRWCEGCPSRRKITSPIQLGAPDLQPAAPSRPAVLRLSVAAAAAKDSADLQQSVEDALAAAEAKVAAARAAEGEAIGRRDRARSRYSLSSRLGTPEDEREANLREKMEADAQAREAIAARTRMERALEKLRAASATLGLPAGANPDVWQRLSLIAPGGVVKPADTVGNVLRIFNEDPAWSSRLTFDAFALEVCLDGATVPEGKATDLTAEMGYRYTLDTTTARVKECMYASARQREFHPIRQYLDGLTWDGTSRLDTLLFEGFGVEAGGEFDDVIRLISRRFALGLVARAYHPGCQADDILVLQGAQGDGKSRCLEAMVGSAWFARTDLDMKSKDGYLQVRGTWLYELQEIPSSRRDAEAMKAWASSDHDKFRAPYESKASSHARQGLVAWTVNPEQFLTDSTGNRRYKVVSVGRTLDPDWIEAHRDALFAEAVVLYKSEEHLGRKRSEATRWWFQKGESDYERHEEMVSGYEVVDPWRFPIYTHLVAEARRPTPKGTSKPYSFTAEDILTKVFQRVSGDVTQSDLTRVGMILKKFQITTERKSLAGSRHTYYYLDADSKARLGVLSEVQQSSTQVPNTNNPFEARG